MNIELIEFPFGVTSECTRCGAPDMDADRGEYAMIDEAESSQSSTSGNLCSECFFDAMAFVNGKI